MLSMITAMAELDYLLFAQKEVCEMLISVTGRAEDILFEASWFVVSWYFAAQVTVSFNHNHL